MFEAAIFTIIFILTFIGVGLFRRWSLKKELFDVPNARSSHIVPTPRGGGAVIVFICLVSYVFLSFYIDQPLSWGYFSGALIIALVSWLDDLYSISFVWRFLVHSLAAGLVILELGFWNRIEIPFSVTPELDIFGAIITFLWIVWLTNAYNFMDGIDGIAGIQALTAGLGWFLIGKLLGFDLTAVYGGVLAFSALGFLIHNWQPAKIFMGDVGSAFLGFTFAVMPLLAVSEKNEQAARLPLIAVLLVWFFVFDTVITFIRRLFKKQKVWTAHREHLYQKLVIGGKSHAFVSILYGVLSLVVALLLTFWINSGQNYILLFTSVLLLETVAIVFLTFTNKNVDEQSE